MTRGARNYRKIHVAAAMAALLLTEPALAQEGPLNVLSPGVIYNAGLQDLAVAYTKETGTKVVVKAAGMSKIVDSIKNDSPIADVVILPVAFMDGMEAEGTIQAGTRVDLGRVMVGLAVPKGQRHPDISSPEKLAGALKAGGTVLYSNPASGSMEARIVNDMLHRYAIFQGVKSKISLKGEGGEALVRGEGDMALQLSCEIVNHPELELVGLLPVQLGAYIDTAVGVSVRSTQADRAKAFVSYLTRPDHNPIWRSRGLDRNPTKSQ
jgi:molybdate transport system substrate-binding protein